MTRHRNTLSACIILVVFFAILSLFLASENSELENQLQQFNRGSQAGEQTSRSRRTRQISNRELTVGRLLNQGPNVRNASELLRSFFTANETGNLVLTYTIGYKLKKLSLEELRQLRVDLRKLPKLDTYLFESLETWISNAELAVAGDDLENYLDEAITSSRFDRALEGRMREWALSDPNAAVAWFRSKNKPDDFRIGSISDRKNRAVAFAALLRGLAPQNPELAVEMFTNEVGPIEREEAGSILATITINQAIASNDTRLLARFLEVAPNQADPYGSYFKNPWHDFTRATGDPMRSVELLRSLQNQDHFGRKMAAIIAGRSDLSFQNRVEWLNHQIPDTEQRLEALESSFSHHHAQDSFQQDLEESIAKPPGPTRDLELLGAARALYRMTLPEDADRVTAEISDPNLRERAEEIRGQNPFIAADQ